jgi:DNA-binding MarR family transcriptional regulator
MPGSESVPLLLYLHKQVELAVRARLDEIVRPAGLTATQYTALSVLERHVDMSSAELARLSFVTAQSMADMITALEGRALIERHRDRADRRRLVVALTAGGQALLDRYRGEVAALAETMIAGLSGQEIASFRSILRTCYDNLSPSQLRPPLREAGQAAG